MAEVRNIRRSQGLRTPHVNANRAAEGARAQAVQEREPAPQFPPQDWAGNNTRRARTVEAARQAGVESGENDFRSSATIPQVSAPAPAPAAPAPRTPARQAPARNRAPTLREMSADGLNEISLRLARGGTPTTDLEKRLADRMGLAYKKGGLVNSKAKGNMPMRGVPATKKPAPFPPARKPAPFKKGGAVKKAAYKSGGMVKKGK